MYAGRMYTYGLHMYMYLDLVYIYIVYVYRYICRTQQELRKGKGREGLEEIDSSNFDS